jgi:hypothetical protein
MMRTTDIRALLITALWLGALAGALALAPSSTAAQGVDPFADDAALDESSEPVEGDDSEADEGLDEASGDAAEASQVEPAADPEASSTEAEGSLDVESKNASDLLGSTDVSGRSGSEDEDFELRVHAGMGMGSRSFERPVASGVQRLGGAAFAAADVGLQAEGRLSGRFALGVRLDYHSSLGLSVQEDTLFGLPNEVSVRVQRMAGAVVPSLRFGDASDSLALAVPIGFGARTFWHQLHGLQTPNYTLAGPEMRIELVAPFGDLVTVRVGPELQWLVFVGKAVRREGVSSSGLALGGEVVVTLHLTDVLDIGLSYRESHAFASGEGGAADFEDVERFGTARVGGTF